MDSLQEILGKKDFTPPDEIAAVKAYIKRKYQSNSYIRLERGALIVRVPSSALAGTLQLEKQKIVEKCGVKSKLVIRTGS